MNIFLRSRKILKTERHMVSDGGHAFWCFCIKYTDVVSKKRSPKIDYKTVLEEAAFERFNEMRQIRKQLAQNDGIPAYAVFTDQELAALAKHGKLKMVRRKRCAYGNPADMS